MRRGSRVCGLHPRDDVRRRYWKFLGYLQLSFRFDMTCAKGAPWCQQQCGRQWSVIASRAILAQQSSSTFSFWQVLTQSYLSIVLVSRPDTDATARTGKSRFCSISLLTVRTQRGFLARLGKVVGGNCMGKNQADGSVSEHRSLKLENLYKAIERMINNDIEKLQRKKYQEAVLFHARCCWLLLESENENCIQAVESCRYLLFFSSNVCYVRIGC